MEKVLGLLLLAFALSESLEITNLDAGKKCLSSLQCKSRCCHRSSLIMGHCANKAAENEACSPKPHLGNKIAMYKNCPCGDGFICTVNKTIAGSTSKNDVGICQGPAKP